MIPWFRFRCTQRRHTSKYPPGVRLLKIENRKHRFDCSITQLVFWKTGLCECILEIWFLSVYAKILLRIFCQLNNNKNNFDLYQAREQFWFHNATAPTRSSWQIQPCSSSPDKDLSSTNLAFSFIPSSNMLDKYGVSFHNMIRKRKTVFSFQSCLQQDTWNVEASVRDFLSDHC